MKKLILNSQKQQIFKSMVATRLEPSLFYWEVEESKFTDLIFVSKLCYNETNYFFKFDFLKEHHYCIYSPAQDQRLKEDYPGDWFNQEGYVDKWLAYLKRELESFDPWIEIDKYLPGADVNFKDEKENSPFSYDQVEHITIALNKLKSEIKNNFNLSDPQYESTQQKLNYLIDRSKKMGRIDWKNLFLGTLMGLAANLALNSEQARTLWNLVKLCFKGILLLGK